VLWSAACSTVGYTISDWSPRGWYWGQYCLTSLLVTWMMRQNAHSASL